jgi:tRNA G10  N-methylase Trm11
MNTNFNSSLIYRNRFSQSAKEMTVITSNIDPDIIVGKNGGGIETWEIPSSANTKYLAHSYFRYIGQFPPQIARALIRLYGKPGQILFDPMVGGGTTMLEARLAGLNAVGSDINPVALIWSKVRATCYEPGLLEKSIREHIDRTNASLGDKLDSYTTGKKKVKGKELRLGDDAKFFSQDALNKLSVLTQLIEEVPDEFREFALAALLSIVRKISLADKKKMNVVVNPKAAKYETVSTYVRKLQDMTKINRELCERIDPRTTLTITRQDARSVRLDSESVDMVIVHPPYPTNTSFSESLRLQLSLLGVEHSDLFKNEVQIRGSYFHKKEGVRNYLVDWHKILSEIHRVLKPNRYCGVVIGDGRFEFVRLPMGAITKEFAADLGFSVERFVEHILVNNTGRTLNRRMISDYVIVLRKKQIGNSGPA